MVIYMQEQNFRIYYKNAPITSVIYIIGEESDDVISKIDIKNAALVFVPVENWNRDLSPYPAKTVFKGGEDFSGGADAFYQKLKDDIVPKAESALPLSDNCVRGIAGYSLAGLFAMYALTKGGFVLAASMSGSLWYPGFSELLKSAELPKNACVYLSLGDKEAKTKNPVLKTVRASTEEAQRILTSRGVCAYFEINPGNHYTDTAIRVAKGINHLISITENEA